MKTSCSQQRSHPIHSILYNTPLQTSNDTKEASGCGFKIKPDHEVSNSSWRGKQDSVETAATPRKGLVEKYPNLDFSRGSLNNAYIQSEICRQRKINEGIRERIQS